MQMCRSCNHRSCSKILMISSDCKKNRPIHSDMYLYLNFRAKNQQAGATSEIQMKSLKLELFNIL